MAMHDQDVDEAIFTQKEYEESVNVERQDIALPFTNGRCRVTLRKVDCRWLYIKRDLL